MSKGTVVALRGKEEVVDPLTELLRVKGRELLAAAVQAEAAAFLEEYAERCDGQGRRGYGQEGGVEGLAAYLNHKSISQA